MSGTSLRAGLMSVWKERSLSPDQGWQIPTDTQIKNSAKNKHPHVKNLQFPNPQVRANNCLSNEFIQENGVPQGSALSVSLFLIAINDITKNCTYPVKFKLYADDFNFWCRVNPKSQFKVFFKPPQII
ncbi:hypothetical protein QTP88_012026 [Uroleucon formosanum]